MIPAQVTWWLTVRVIVKAAALFVLVNIGFAITDPVPTLGKISLYNTLVPGRARLPYGENDAAYNLSLNSIEAMLSSHEINRMNPHAYNVWVFGDSSVWGILLDNPETLTGQINAANVQIDGRPVRAYNLAHPILSVTKDLMLIEQARALGQPDLIVWLLTLDSLPYRDQLAPPLVAQNPVRVRDLIRTSGLPLHPNNPQLADRTFFDYTLVGQRRALADWLRLQMFGIAWANTGIDQVYGDYTPRANDFERDFSWNAYSSPSEIFPTVLAFEVLGAAHTAARGVPILLVNEPIFIADGANSDIRYNAWYPRWAYDQWRALLAQQAELHGWRLLDLWDAIPPREFTDSPVHLTPSGTRQLSVEITSAIMEYADSTGE
jgi:hypothetical protein